MLKFLRKPSIRPWKSSGRRLKVECLEARQMLTGYLVTKVVDNGLVTEANSLSWAIHQANTHSSGLHEIILDVNTISVNANLPAIEHALTTIRPQDGRTSVHIQNIGSAVNSLTYNGSVEGAGWLIIRDVEISGFLGNAIRIASLGDGDFVDIDNSVLRNNGSSGVSFVDIATGTDGRIRITNNWIYDNGSDAISISSPVGTVPSPVRNTISGNTIGRTQGGVASGNGGHGITLGRNAARFDILNNAIENTSFDAIRLLNTAGAENRISGNSFRNITGLLIDLNDDGVTQSNPSNGNSGPNGLLNRPALRADLTALVGGQWQTTWDYDFGASGSGNYRFEFYRFNFSTSQWTNVANRNVTVSTAPAQITQNFVNGSEFNAGDFIAAIAIKNSGTNNHNTSEFSQHIVLDAAAPRVTNLILSGTGFSYSFDSISAAGQQLDPLTMAGIDTIEIEFSEPVTLSSNPLTLLASPGNPASGGVSVPSISGNVATWTLSAGLTADKYAILLESDLITDAAGKKLDGGWDAPILNNDFTTQPDNIGRPAQTFLSGNGVPGDDFRFHFAVLPTGSTAQLPATVLQGDYDDNEIVDLHDYMVWRLMYGHTQPFMNGWWADGNDDNLVDAADYTVWRNNLDIFSAWSSDPPGGSGGLPSVLFGEAPRVANVTISGSSSTHDPYAFDTATFNGQPVTGSGNQLRTVPVGGADTISITFNEDVNIMAGNLTLTGLRTATHPTLLDFSYDLGTMTATWRFESWDVADHYVIALSDAVTDVEGNPLDGEWVNPVSIFSTNSAISTFPSGNDLAGGDFNFVVTILPGDADRDNLVGGPDGAIVAVNSYFGLTGALFTQGDFSGEGLVTWSDDYISYFVANYGKDLQSLSLLADLNGDWVVDQQDADILFGNRNMSNPTQADGDLDGDGDIDIDDLDLAFAQLGLALSVA